MRILLTGASGFIGQCLLVKLRSQGNQLIRLVRGGAVPPDGSTFAGPADLAAIGSWPHWPSAVDAVVHLAAVIPRTSNPDERELQRVNVDATAALAKRAVKEGVKRIVFLSTASVHGKGGAALIGESSPLAPPNAYARSKMRAEEAFWAALGDQRHIGTVIRPTVVFGAGGHGPVALLAKLAALPVPVPLAGIGGARSLISVEDLAAFIAACLSDRAAEGETFLVANDGALRADGIIRALRSGWGRRGLLVPLPGGLLAAAARVAGKGETWDAMTHPFHVDTARAHTISGWQGGKSAAERLEELAASGALSRR